jgi:hypothetical protein
MRPTTMPLSIALDLRPSNGAAGLDSLQPSKHLAGGKVLALGSLAVLAWLPAVALVL